MLLISENERLELEKILKKLRIEQISEKPEEGKTDLKA